MLIHLQTKLNRFIYCRILYKFLFFIFLITSLFGSSCYAGDCVINEGKIVKIIYINADNRDYPWTKDLVDQLTQKFTQHNYQLEINDIYLNSKKIQSQEDQLKLLKLHIESLRLNTYDLIITTTKTAADLLLKLPYPELKKIPILINSIDTDIKPEGFNNISVVEKSFRYDKTLELGLDLLPSTKKVYVITDNSIRGKYHRDLAQKQLAQYKSRLEISYYGHENVSVDNLLAFMNTRDKNSIILLGAWLSDCKNEYKQPDYYYSIFTKAASVPVFMIADLGFQDDQIGGYIARGTDNCRMIAEMAYKIFTEKLLSTNKEIAPPVAIINKAAINRWGIDPSKIPSDVTVIAHEQSFYSKYKTYIIFGSFTLLFFVICFILIFYYMTKYRRRLFEIQNITNEKDEVTQKLAKKSDIQRNTIDSFDTGIIVCSANYEIWDVNQSAINKLGDVMIKSSDCVLHDYLKISSQKSVLNIEEIIQNVISKQFAFYFEDKTFLLTKDHELIPIKGAIQPLYAYSSISVGNIISKDVPIIGAIITFEDISEKIKLKELYHISLSALNAFTWVFDTKMSKLEYLDGRPHVDNPDDYCTTAKILKRIHPDDRDDFAFKVERYLKSDQNNFMTTYRVQSVDNGEYSWWESRAYKSSFVNNTEMDSRFIYGIDFNINQLKENEERLSEALLKAKESDRLKSAFLANMSHEIRTPLNAIVGFSNMIAFADDKEEAAEYVKVIEANNDLLLQLINDILDLSKIEAGKLDFSFSEVSVDDLMNQLAQMFAMRAKPGVQVIYDQPDLSYCINSEKNRLTQVITNFLSNAVKFTDSGSIHLGVKTTENGLYFYVKDTGKGIATENQPLVFNRFSKLDSFVQGTGLGLSICRSIIGNLHGEIGVESELGKGSTFWFTIPVEYTTDNIEDLPSAPRISERSQKSSDFTILIAEDNPSNYMLYEKILSQYKLIHAWDGEEAVAHFKTYAPDLVLMDIRMPRMDGYQANEEIRKLSADVPVYAVTASVLGSEIEKINNHGFNGYLPKPINAKKIKELIESYICIFN